MIRQISLVFICPIICSLATMSCSGGTSSGGSTAPPDKGNRTLAIAVGEGKGETYDEAFDLAAAVGVDEVSLSLDWNQIETPSGFDFTIPDIIDVYYPSKGMPVTLIFRPINTNQLTVPADIASLPFDHATVIARFKAFLAAVRARLANTSVVRVHIGNEIDSYLDANPTRWAAWTTFFQQDRAEVKTLWGTAMPVGSIGQLGAIVDSSTQGYFQTLNLIADDVAVTYYPLEPDFTVKPPAVVGGDFQQIVDLYPGRRIVFTECGYPSGLLCNSSEALQSQFVREVFLAWDRHRAAIVHIDFAWQTDTDAATVDQWVIDYGMTGSPYVNAFKEYLGTLGLRNHDTTNKTAWTTLSSEAALRGW